MKALLINPFDMTITEVEYDGNYQSIYKLISPEGSEVRAFDAVRISAEDTIWVDDEGLLKQNNFFEHTDYPQPMAGLGLVLGTTEDGDSTSPTLTLDQLKDNISWATPFRMQGREGIQWMKVSYRQMEADQADGALG